MPPDSLDNLDINRVIRDAEEATATFVFTSLDGQEQVAEIGPIERIEAYASSSINVNTTSNELEGISLTQPQSSGFFNLQDPVLTTIPNNSSFEIAGNPIQWDNIQTARLQPTVQPMRSIFDRISNLIEDYVRNRNQEDKLFINHNTCQREIEYNSIDDVIEFRVYLDNIIKQHYQGR